MLVKYGNRYSFILHALLACIVCFCIESISRHSLGKGLEFVFDRSWVFLYNSLIIFASLLIVYFFRRRTFMRTLICSLWLFLGTINGCLLMKRVTPFGYTDLKLVRDLFAMQNNYFGLWEEILAVALVGMFLLFLAVLFIKGPKYQGKIHYGTSAILLASCFLWIPMCTKAAVSSHLLSSYFENIALGYEDYGFVYGFSTSVVDRGMTKPENYSEEAVAAANDQSKELKTAAEGKDQPNIVLVLLESFIDPEEVKFLECSKDPAPNFRRLSKKFTSGYLKVPVVGAGTANTEFEMLTGMSLKFFGTGEYPYKTILKSTDCESAASDLSQIGYGTHVVHNNGGNFYSRANAFSQMGFDTFTSKEMMNISEYTPLGAWPTDHILLSEVEKAMDATADQPDFVYTITVQSHGDYPTDQVLEHPEIRVTGADSEEKNNQWEYYVNQLHEVDQFIGDLVTQLSKRDEKTVLVLFGDHLPTMGLNNEDMKSGDIFLTQYATWNNFGMEKKDEALTAYQLMAKITQDVGIHEGTLFRFHQAMRAAGEETYLAGVENLQYDLLYGKRYSYHGQELYPATQLEMGVEDIRVQKIFRRDEAVPVDAEEEAQPSPDSSAEKPKETEGQETEMASYAVVQGENYTPWSRVFVNGEQVKTIFVSGTELKISGDELEDGDQVMVNQMGSSSTVFRSSNAYIFRELWSDTP